MAPNLKVRQSHFYTNASYFAIRPLFPRYVFARFGANLISKVRYTRGVHSIVDFGDGPVMVADEVIESIRSRILADGFVKLGEEFKSGDKVFIKSGPLKNLEGVFDKDLKASKRVMILLTSVNYDGRLIVERDVVQKAICTPKGSALSH